ncbi:MAG: hypothetical protein EOM23_05610, partial [Candidatus Moranbacteria bacterium]|nr:hypothetical protein [Candidatus Moranbacteria bacterium]
MLLEGFFAVLSNILLFTSKLDNSNSFPHPLSSEKEQEFIKKGETFHKQWQNMPHYAAMVESMDENVGRLLHVLEQENLTKNTIV